MNISSLDQRLLGPLRVEDNLLLEILNAIDLNDKSFTSAFLFKWSR